MDNIQQSLFSKLYPCQNGKFLSTKQLKPQLHTPTQAVAAVFMKEWGTIVFNFLPIELYKECLWCLMLPKIQEPLNRVFSSSHIYPSGYT